jgi:hypothetical protein
MAKKSLWALLNAIDARGPVAPEPAMEYVREAERQTREGLKSADELSFWRSINMKSRYLHFPHSLVKIILNPQDGLQ